MIKHLLIVSVLFLASACGGAYVDGEVPSVTLRTKAAECITPNDPACREVVQHMTEEEVKVIYGAPPEEVVPPASRLKRLTTPGDPLDPRSNFTNEFKDRKTKQAFTVAGKVKVITWNTETGLYRKDLDAIPLDIVMRDPSDIPTVTLAFEHWWLSIELLMKGQREYRECVGRISEIQRIKGVACKLDDPCSPWYGLILSLSEYWIPVNAWDNFKEYPPGIQTYQEHFRAGAIGVAQIISHRDACRSSIEWWRNN